jgi:transposase-like protein
MPGPIHQMTPSIVMDPRAGGRTISELAQEFEPAANAIRKWIKRDDGLCSDGLTTREYAELNWPRRKH